MSAEQTVSNVMNTKLFLAENSKDLQIPDEICDEDGLAVHSCKLSPTVELPSIYSSAFNMGSKKDKSVMKKCDDKSNLSKVFTSVKSIFSKKGKSTLPEDYNNNHIPPLADQKIPATSAITTNTFLIGNKDGLLSIDLGDGEDFNNNSFVIEPATCSCFSIMASIKKNIVKGFRRIFRIKSGDKLKCKGEVICNS